MGAIMDCISKKKTCSPLSLFLRELNITNSSIIVVDNHRRYSQNSTSGTDSSMSSSCSQHSSFYTHGDSDAIVKHSAKKQVRRTVSFHPDVEVSEYLPHSNKEDLFYSKEEYTCMKREAHSTIIKQAENIPIDDTMECLRGLESFSARGLDQKRRARLHANLVVQTEQYHQWCEKGPASPVDFDAISLRYREVSSKCQRRALQRGIDDFFELSRIWIESSSSSSTSSTQTISTQRRKGSTTSPLQRNRPIRSVQIRSAGRWAAT
eukprot:scaffold7542_cov113-Cylindrotheca_fusiformis.AAC.3